MGKVVLGISMSLDGFVAGPNDDVEQVFKWFFGGDTDIQFPGDSFVGKVSPASAKLMEEAFKMNGAMVAGRRMFDLAQAWGGHPPFAPCFIVTHHPPQEWIKPGSPFVFVTDGVDSAIRQAKQAAGDKNVAVATADVTQQCLKLGLLDEINIDLVPVLLGEGTRLFDHLGKTIELEYLHVIAGSGVTHLRCRVVR